LEKSREAVDLSNIRAAYAEASAAALTDPKKNETESGTTVTYTAATSTAAATYSVDVAIQQQKTGWVVADPKCANTDLSSLSVKSGDTVTVSVSTEGAVSIAKKATTPATPTTTPSNP
jgi:hypothetical protein